MKKRTILFVAFAVATSVVAIVFVISKKNEPESWKKEAEGLLAVPTPCCTEATLFESLEVVTEDGQRPRPATATEAAEWLNRWPYRERSEIREKQPAEPPNARVRNEEVRCSGAATGPDIVPTGNDPYTLEAIRLRRECVFAKWRVWSGDPETTPPNERHTVWAGEDGFFYGRVDYWR